MNAMQDLIKGNWILENFLKFFFRRGANRFQFSFLQRDHMLRRGRLTIDNKGRMVSSSNSSPPCSQHNYSVYYNIGYIVGVRWG